MVFRFTNRMLMVTTVVVLCLVLITPLPLPIEVSPDVQATFDTVENDIPDGGVAYVNLASTPANMLDASSYPPLIAFTQHLFDKGMKVIFICLAANYPTSPLYVQWILDPANKVIAVDTHGAVYGEDYVIFPAVMSESGMMSWLADIRSVTPYDYFNTPVDDIPMMENIHNAYDFDVGLATGFITDQDFRMSNAIYGVPILVGVLDSYAPGFQHYVLSGQCIGLLWGARRSAEYELLLGKKGGQGFATLGQLTGITAVFMIVLVFSNITDPFERKRVGG